MKRETSRSKAPMVRVTSALASAAAVASFRSLPQTAVHSISTTPLSMSSSKYIGTGLGSSTYNLPNAVQAQNNIVWFRDNLRVHDNYVLNTALDIHNKKLTSDDNKDKSGTDTKVNSNESNFICVYCFNPDHYKTTKYGTKKTGIYRTKFLIESVMNLRQKLRGLGNDLFVAYGYPEKVLEAISMSLKSNTNSDSNCDSINMKESNSMSYHMITNIYVQKEVTSEEIKEEQKVFNMIGRLHNSNQLITIEGNKNLYHPSQIMSVFRDNNLSDMPNTFTVFREKIEKVCSISSLTPPVNSLPSTCYRIADDMKGGFDYIPSLSDLGYTEEDIVSHNNIVKNAPKGVMNFIGGEDQAMKRIQGWMFDGNHLKDYFEIRNGMLGEEYSSKLSPWLANGCVSPRLIYSEVKRYERERRISNKSTYWLVFELIWRDFFYYLCAKYGNDIFKVGGAHRLQKSWSMDETKIQRWKNGMTGEALVDANMKELLYTGWMSNRGRQIVASYLVYDLKIDWRIGASHFEELLLDHDVTSNYGNWNAAAGLTGGRINKFNVAKQAATYDYVRYWLSGTSSSKLPLYDVSSASSSGKR